MFEERCLSTRRVLTFAKAMQNYLDLGRAQPKFAKRILLQFGTRLCSEIDNTAMIEARNAIFPAGAKAPYINRHLYTPVIAILRLASKDKACARPDFERPQGYDLHPPVESPKDDGWLVLVMRELNPEARAVVAILSVHGRRVGELLSRHPRHLDPDAGTLNLGRTKNKGDVFLRLEPAVLKILLAMPDWQEREHLFRYKPVSGVNAINQALRDACARADVPYYSTHKLGRHRFAHRLLDAGASLQHVKDAGGWQTLKVLSDRYGSRAMAEHTETVHRLGGEVMKRIELKSD